MKKCIILIQLFFLTSSVFAQSSKDLDDRNGYKDFILGDPISKWKSNLVELWRSERNQEEITYEYKGNCCKDIFGYRTASIALTFRKDKLIVIHAVTDKLQKSHKESGIYTKYTGFFNPGDAKNIAENLVALFGQPANFGEDNKKRYVLQWHGNKVGLEAIYEYFGVVNGDRVEIIVFDTIANAEITKGEF